MEIDEPMRTSCALLLVLVPAMAAGCGGAVIEPGHRGLLFNPSQGGLQHEILPPGWMRLPCPIWTPASHCPRIDDFDVTFQTRHERVTPLAADGLPVELGVTVTYRPIISELFQLDTEIGPSYYEDVVAGELRASVRDAVCKVESRELRRRTLEPVGDSIERELRKRLAGHRMA